MWVQPLLAARRPQKILSGIVAFLLLYIAYRLRLEVLGRELWLDEFVHAITVWNVRDVYDIALSRPESMQPQLDYLVRKIFWAPLLGGSELSHRIPSLFYSFATCIFLLWATPTILKRRGWNFFTRFAATVAITAYFIYLPVNIHYATEARHYSFITLISVVWSFYFLFLFDSSKGRISFWVLSLIFLNTHYFSIFLVAPAFLVLICWDWSHQRKREACYTSLVVLFTLVAIAGVNWESVRHLAVFALRGIRSGTSVPWYQSVGSLFAETQQVFFSAPIFFSLLVFSAQCFRLPELKFSYSCFCMLLFCFLVSLVLVSLQGKWPYQVRYSMSFAGVFFSLAIWAMLGLESLLPRLSVSLREKISLSLFYGSLLLVAVLFTTSLQLPGQWPKPNFSKTYKSWKRFIYNPSQVMFFWDREDLFPVGVSFYTRLANNHNPNASQELTSLFGVKLFCDELKNNFQKYEQLVYIHEKRAGEHPDCWILKGPGIKTVSAGQRCIYAFKSNLPSRDIEKWVVDLGGIDCPAANKKNEL